MSKISYMRSGDASVKEAGNGQVEKRAHRPKPPWPSDILPSLCMARPASQTGLPTEYLLNNSSAVLAGG